MSESKIEEQKIEKVNVSPGMQFYELLESYPYTVKGALCEYIDNALEAFRKGKEDNIGALPEKLTITININSNKITIDDDGTGIKITEIQNAMKPANKRKEQSLSEFGIGMKAASMWLGNKWTLESYPIHSNFNYQLIFDLDKLLSDNSEEVKISDIQSPKKTNGVKITLEDLHNTIELNQAKRTWEEIQETYHYFTSKENPKPILNLVFKYKNRSLEKKKFSELKVANIPLIFPECKYKDGKLFAIGEDKVWKKDIDFEFDGKRVHGFFSLGKESSQASNPGIRLFRFGRLIKGMEISPYRPAELVGTANKAAPSRFYAELHLDGQAISNSKGEFVFDEYLFIEKIKEQDGVSSFIEQAEQYRSQKAEKGEFESFDTWEEFEKETGSKPKQPKGNTDKTKKKSTTSSKTKKKPEDPIVVLKKLSAPTTFLLLDTFIEEAIILYKLERFWGFCLVYRAILEVSIIDKIKSLDEEHYDKVKSKSIVPLYKYLQSNSQIIPDEYETLKRVLKEANRDSDPFVGILNIASHGRYKPTKHEVQDLLRNTQQLVEWSFDRIE